MKIINYLRRLKWLYALYNFFHYKQLRHNLTVFKKYGIRKNYFSRISFRELEELTRTAPLKEQPWLDAADSKVVLPKHKKFNALDVNTQKALLNWSRDGYAILEKFYSSSDIDFINEEIQRLLKEKKLTQLHNGKVMFGIDKSQKLRETASPERLTDILSLLLGRKVKLFQSINFFNGSQQDAHSDSIHMTTFPLGFLIAVWIALEDIEVGSGPLFYYPGSHKLNYVMNADFRKVDNPILFDEHDYTDYERRIDEVIHENGITENKKTFLAKKGDLLIWHANLLHGGNPIQNPKSTRNSMVLHYYAEDVICFHEITERPALLA